MGGLSGLPGVEQTVLARYPESLNTLEQTMTFSIQVDNIKCSGCANTIRKRLTQLPGVGNVTVDIEQGVVEVEADVQADAGLRDAVAESLLHAGYPESGSASGMASIKAKATSFVSCAIGRMSDKE
jgi:copper chaperone